MSCGSVKVGRLLCQTDSRRRKLETKIVSCEAAGGEFKVELEDTVLFPEGGGQPTDHGTITVLPKGPVLQVLKVVREGVNAIHYVPQAVLAGTEVEVEVFWERRWDHTQQHSGQHLLSAVIEQRLGLETLSWCLGTDENYIELARKVSEEEVELVVAEANQHIQEALPVSVEIRSAAALGVVATLPKDYDVQQAGGLLREVIIAGIDKNLCCGTHVTSTSQLASLVCFSQCPGKGSNWRLFFAVGDRLRKKVVALDLITKGVAKELSCAVPDCPARVQQINENIKTVRSTIKQIMLKLAAAKVKQINEELATDTKRMFVQMEDGNADFVGHLVRNITVTEGLELLVIVSGAKDAVSVYVLGRDAEHFCTEELQQKFPSLKGAFNKKTKIWQGKATLSTKDIRAMRTMVG